MEKYQRDVRSFATWLGVFPLNKEAVIAWKEHLRGAGYAPATINSMLIAINQFFRFQYRDELRVKTLRLQRRIFRSRNKELTKEEYARLIETAHALGRERLALLMETICKRAGVAPSKVFPHNLRHLFARTFYKACRDVVQLADVLGHSSVETTRIYLASSGMDHVCRMERLGLIL